MNGSNRFSEFFKRLSWIGVLSMMILVIGFSGCLSIQLSPKLGSLKEKTISGKGHDKVVLMDINGVISNKKQVSTLGTQTGVGMVDRVREILKKAPAFFATHGT